MYAWYSYAEGILKQGISLSAFGFNPVWKLLLIPIAYTYSWLSNILHISVISVSLLPPNFDPSYGITVVTDPVFNSLVKIPLIIADLLSTFLIYRITYHYTGDKSLSHRSSLLYFLNPIVIWISAAWGQYDSLAVLFTLLSFYFLLVDKKTIVSSLCIYIAFLTKIYPIIFLIPITALILKFEKDRLRKLFIYWFPLIPVALYQFIFYGVESFRSLADVIFPGYFLFTSGYGLTYWSISLIVPLDIFWSRLIMYVGTLVFILLSIYYIFQRAKTPFNTLVDGSFLLTATLFLFLTIVTEQRTLMLLGVLSLLMFNHWSLRKYVLSLSLLAFLHTQKNFPFYLLPLASRYPDSFSFMFSTVSPYINRTPFFIAPSSSIGLILFLIGASFSGILLILLWKIFRKDSDNELRRREIGSVSSDSHL